MAHELLPEEGLRAWLDERWAAWLKHRRATRSEQLLGTSSGARVLGATLTTLEPDDQKTQLRVW